MRLGDVIAAVASPPGRGARGIVRLSGGAVREVLGALLEGPARPFDRACFAGVLCLDDRALPVLVATYRGPASYTGEDGAELLLPGNPLLLERVLAHLLDLPGVRLAEPGEFTARAYLNERLTLDQAEGVAATIAARGEEQLRAAADLLEGRTGSRYRAWAEEAATLLALVEAGIDFTDQEDVVPIAPRMLEARARALEASIAEHTGANTGAEAHEVRPRVVLAGLPNAGKSTLFNALLGRVRSVVSTAAGTTRDVLEEELDLSRDLPGAGSVALCDLAGLDEAPGAPIDMEAQHAALRAIRGADVVVQCDPSGRFRPSPETSGTIIRVRTKADLPGEHAGLEVCALDGWNLSSLRRAIADAACAGGAAGVVALLPRHRRAAAEARRALRDAQAFIDSGQETLGAPELVAGSLRAALDALGELSGRITPDDVIGRVFSLFCVGK